MSTKLLFIGSNWEAEHTLRVLVADSRFEIVGLITQPDKPVGRKRIITPSSIKLYAEEQGIPVYHTLNEESRYQEAIEIFKPEIIVCKSFGEMIPDTFLNWPKFGSINVHYSLLPKYRGAVPIQKAILEGDSITGITYVQMVHKMDAGGILAQFEEQITPDDTNQTLRERLVKITGDTIGDILQGWIEGEITLTEQDETKVSYCWQKDIAKENAFLDFSSTSADVVDRMVRALLPWPVAWCEYNGKRLKIYKCTVVKIDALKLKSVEKGTFFEYEKILHVRTDDDAKCIELKEVQLEGKTLVTADIFLQSQTVPSLE